MTSGMSGKVALNSVGDRTPNYELTGTLDNGSAVVIARVVTDLEGIDSQQV